MLTILVSLLLWEAGFASAKNYELAKSCKSSFSQAKLASQQQIFDVQSIIDILPIRFIEFKRKTFYRYSANEIFEKVLKARVSQINALDELLRHKAWSPVQKELIKVAILKLEASLEANIQNIQIKIDKVGVNKKWKKVIRDAATQKEDNVFIANLISLFNESRAVLTETLVALKTKNVVATEMHIEQILKKKAEKWMERNLDNPIYEESKDLEMDIVSEDYKVWTEVKSFNSTDSKHLKRLVQHLESKTKRIADLQYILAEDLGFKPQFKIVIVGKTKIPEESLLRLRQAGAVVEVLRNFR